MYGRSIATHVLLGLGFLITPGRSQSLTGFAKSPLDGTPESSHYFHPNSNDTINSLLYSWRRPSCPWDNNHVRAGLDSFVDGEFLGIGTESNVLNADAYATRIVNFGVQLSHLRQIDTGSSTFEAQILLSFLWYDNFSETRATNTTEHCRFYCDLQFLDCCDHVWVPSFSISNMLEVSHVASSLGGYKDAGDTTYGSTSWDLRLDATFSTDLDFQNFPFDSQELKVIFFIPQHANVYFEPTIQLTSAYDGANGLFQDIRKGSTADGWMLHQVYMKPLCNATSWGRYFRYRYRCLKEALAKMPNGTTPEECRHGQHEEMEDYLEHLGEECPPFVDGGLGDGRFADVLEATTQEYDACTAHAWNLKQPPPTLIGSEPHGYGNDTDPNSNSTSIPLSMRCLMQAVANVTRTGFEVTIRVKRYRGYYVIKLFIPVVACVLFAFTAFAIPLENIAERLTVIVPAVIALTALQVLVVATDVPVVSQLVPTSYLMLCAYTTQLLMALACVCAYSREQYMRPREHSIATHDPEPAGKISSPSGETIVSKGLQIKH